MKKRYISTLCLAGTLLVGSAMAQTAADYGWNFDTDLLNNQGGPAYAEIGPWASGGTDGGNVTTIANSGTQVADQGDAGTGDGALFVDWSFEYGTTDVTGAGMWDFVNCDLLDGGASVDVDALGVDTLGIKLKKDLLTVGDTWRIRILGGQTTDSTRWGADSADITVTSTYQNLSLAMTIANFTPVSADASNWFVEAIDLTRLAGVSLEIRNAPFFWGSGAWPVTSWDAQLYIDDVELLDTDGSAVSDWILY